MAIRHITVDRSTNKVNIYARDDGRIYYSLIGKEGIHDIGSKMDCNIQSTNSNGGYTVRVSDGVCSIQGRMAIIDPNNYHDVVVPAQTSDTFPRHDRIVLRFSSNSTGDEAITATYIKNNGAMRNDSTFAGGAYVARDVQIADVYVQSKTHITVTMLDSAYIRNISNIDNDVVNATSNISTLQSKTTALENKTSCINSDGQGGYNGDFSQIILHNGMYVMDGSAGFNDINCAALTTGGAVTNSSTVTNNSTVTNKSTVTNNGAVINNNSTTCAGSVTCNSTLTVSNYIKTNKYLHIYNSALNTAAEVFKITRGSSNSYPLSLNYTTTNTFLLKYNNAEAIKLGTDIACIKKINAEGGIYATKDVSINGTMKCNNIMCGSVSVSPQVNTTKQQWVSFPKAFKTVPIVTVTAQGTVPSELIGLTVSGTTTGGFNINLLKSSSAVTTINWIAMDMLSALNI